MSTGAKFQVPVFAATKPKKIPKVVSEQLKGGASPKQISRMKKESVNCPIVKREVGFLICFSCPSFLNRISGVVGCAGGQGPPLEWLVG